MQKFGIWKRTEKIKYGVFDENAARASFGETGILNTDKKIHKGSFYEQSDIR